MTLTYRAKLTLKSFQVYLQWAHLHAPKTAGVECAQLQAEGTREDKKTKISFTHTH